MLNPLAPSEIVFQEQLLQSTFRTEFSGDIDFRGDIDDPSGVIADFCGVIADPCGVAIPEAIGGRRFRSLHDSLNIVKHC